MVAVVITMASSFMMMTTIIAAMLLIICTMTPVVHGQVSSDQVVQVWVSDTLAIGNGRTNVTLSWIDRTGVTLYTVNRFVSQTAQGTNVWTPVASLANTAVAGRIVNFVTTVNTSVEYDYQ